jgi:hypothetical protein
MAPQGASKINGAIGSIKLDDDGWQPERGHLPGLQCPRTDGADRIELPRRLPDRTFLGLQHMRLRMDNITASLFMTTFHQEQDTVGHRFAAGRMVRFSAVFPYRNVSKGNYEVLAQLPVRDGEYQYRIKNNCETYERIAKQNELEAA